MVGLAFITPQTSEETAIVNDDDNRHTTKPASRETWAKKNLQMGCFEVESGREAILFKSR